MTWDTLFLLANYWAIGGWIALAFLPRGPRILSLILYAGVSLLCLAYAIMLGGFLTGTIDPGGPGGGSFTTLAGVMRLFAAPGGATLGWIHYLAFDLFTGLWIARDADNKGFGRVVQLPFLFLTLMVGPVGLLAWLVVRERRARAQARAK
ncbi:ABA4-like family protein [Sphingopyxis sp. PET50]|uniref:ABA4-like family protein n=1 Tax=Sphingopyxis sp. PET50 TaxID=2976533 RepID=UPI0021AEFD89|nr:ABA4-like family protein [Sphingopyxis sp. PET50]